MRMGVVMKQETSTFVQINFNEKKTNIFKRNFMGFVFLRLKKTHIDKKQSPFKCLNARLQIFEICVILLLHEAQWDFLLCM